jgi:hypothetical protein
MTPEVQDLLALLSILPDGLLDSDLVQVALPIPNLLSTKATLLRTSLAYMGNDHRVMVLVPVCEHLRTVHPVAAPLKISLRHFFHNVIGVWDEFHDVVSEHLVSQISANLGNLISVLEDGMDINTPDFLEMLHSTLSLNDFFRTTNRGLCPLIGIVQAKVVHVKNQKIYGDYLIERLESSTAPQILDSEDLIAKGNKYFEGADPFERGGTSFGQFFKHTLIFPYSPVVQLHSFLPFDADE